MVTSKEQEVLFTVEEVALKLNVSKVTIYNKIKNYEDKIIIKNGIWYINNDLFYLIKGDIKKKNPGIKVYDLLKIKEMNSSNKEYSDNEISTMINYIISQLEEKDKQINEKDKQINELIKANKLQAESLQKKITVDEEKLKEHFQNLDKSLLDLRERMINRKEHTKKGLKNYLKNILNNLW